MPRPVCACGWKAARRTTSLCRTKNATTSGSWSKFPSKTVVLKKTARPLALLRQIEMRGDVDEPRFDSFLSKSREALMPFVNSEGRIPSARMRRTMAKGCVISRATQPIGRAAPSTGADPIGRWRSSLAARG